MKLSKEQYELNNDQITHQYPRHITLDYLMIRFFLLLKHDGRQTVTRAVTRGAKAKTFSVEVLREYLEARARAGALYGFAHYPDVVEEWIYSDLTLITYRGRPDKEKYAAPVPLHLETPRLRVNTQVKDDGASRQIFAMIYHLDPGLLGALRRALGEHDDAPDLYTLAILQMIEAGGLDDRPTSKAEDLQRPLCTGQARLLCDDLRRLLAYVARLPRAVFVEYLKMVFGLHLGLYALRIAHQLSGWMHDRQAHPACSRCPVYADAPQPFAPCPFACQHDPGDGERHAFAMPPIMVDMGDNFRTHMAQLAMQNFKQHSARLTDYVRAVLTVNQALRAGKASKVQRRLGYPVISIEDALRLINDAPDSFRDFFDDQIDSLFPDGDLEDEPRDIQAIYREEGLAPFEKYMELVALKRTSFNQTLLRSQIDSTLMKNTDSGLLVQGKGARNTRRWQMGSRLLDLLAHLALLDVSQDGTCTPRTMLIDEFIDWLRQRYGIVFSSRDAQASIQDIAAFNDNLKGLRQRLREIGLYIDLSDAYNTQRLRPRYRID